jgi:hypothetical protein
MRWLSHCVSVGVIAGSLGLVSCATVLQGGSRPGGVTITSEPPAAHVTITNLWTRQPVLEATTPVVASLARHAGYMQPARYQVVVEKPGYEPYILRLEAQVDERYFGNLVAGGPLGLLVIDPLTGAMYALPSHVHTVLARADDAGATPSPSQPPRYPRQSPSYPSEPPFYPPPSQPSPSQPQLYPPLPYEERVLPYKERVQ